MRDYMPPKHRAFIAALETGASVRDYVIRHKTERPSLRDAYNAAIDYLGRFRSDTLGIRAQLHYQAEPWRRAQSQ